MKKEATGSSETMEPIYAITSQKIVILIFTAVRSWDLIRVPILGEICTIVSAEERQRNVKACLPPCFEN
jgi:hypothetical protein